MSSWGPHHSALLSLLLDDVTGTEEAVGITQDKCRLVEFIGPKLSTIYWTGSKAEGLSLPGSDYDFMLDINKPLNIKVVQSLHEISDTSFCNVFLLCTEHVSPGFALLHCNIDLKDPFLIQFLQCKSGEQYLNGNLLIDRINFFFNLISNVTLKRQGPSLETWFEFEDTSGEGNDFVYSIHCQFWPDNASEWIRRTRPFGWPASVDISTIVNFGCHLVPVGHPLSNTKSLEWRISFSIAERILVWSFNHVQMQCYAVMKIILKEFIKRRCSAQNQVLCSYFIKTFLFWKYETTKMDFWCKGNFRECIKYLLTEFSKCIHEGVLRHYFFPKFNLLSVKLTTEAQTELMQLFDLIIQYDINILKECTTLQNIWSKFLSANENQMNIIHCEKKSNFIKNDELMMEACNLLANSDLQKVARKLPFVTDMANMLSKQSNIPLMYILTYFSAYISARMGKSRTYDQIINLIETIPSKTCLKSLVVKELHVQKHVKSSVLDISNKSTYKLQHIVQGSSTSCTFSTSKLWYAIVLLKRCDYTSTLNVVNQVLSNIPSFVLYKSASESYFSESKYLYVEKFSNSLFTTMERAKKAWIADLIFIKDMTVILPLGIHIELCLLDIPYLPIALSPFTCAYYLMFLCYHGLGQYDNRDRALQQLIEVVNNREQCGEYRHRSYNIAGHCLLITGERDRARDMFNRSQQFTRGNPERDKHNSATWYLRNFCA